MILINNIFMEERLVYYNAFNKFYWSFFFIMLDFRLQGVDIIPDIIGYLLFAAGLSLISNENSWFEKARKLNIFMIFLSIFQIYERPAQGTGITFGPLGYYGVIIGIASMIISLLLMYNFFMGIGDMAALKIKLK